MVCRPAPKVIFQDSVPVAWYFTSLKNNQVSWAAGIICNAPCWAHLAHVGCAVQAHWVHRLAQPGMAALLLHCTPTRGALQQVASQGWVHSRALQLSQTRLSAPVGVADTCWLCVCDADSAQAPTSHWASDVRGVHGRQGECSWMSCRVGAGRWDGHRSADGCRSTRGSGGRLRLYMGHAENGSLFGCGCAYRGWV